MMKSHPVALGNEIIRVEFNLDRPFPLGYLHEPSGVHVAGTPADVCLSVNGEPISWSDWHVAVSRVGLPLRVAYDLQSVKREYALRFEYELRDFELAMRVTVVSDPAGEVRSVDWGTAPLVVFPGHDAWVWREEYTQKDWNSERGRGLWTPSFVEKPLTEFKLDPEPRPCIYCCAYEPHALCVALHSNQRYMPLRNQATAKGFAMALAPYHFRARGKCLPPLEVQIGFLPDLNADGRIDASDFQLWVNRRLPQAWPTHRNRIWYKIYCGDRGTPMTTFAQAEEIVERVHRYTDGLPQIVYLVGWQYEGHDSGYPSIDKVNAKLGSREDLWAFHKRAKESLDTVVSYHINLDDSYPNHPGWDESVICREPDGRLMTWEPFNDGMSYHISHTKDVESGKVFRKLDAMMREVPLEAALHIDAFRDMNWSWEPDGLIGAVEELECGIKPIIEYLNARGIDVTVESLDSQGAEWCGLVSGLLHFGYPRDMVQLRHGKMIHGGRAWPPTLWSWGIGSTVNWDQIFTEDGKDFYTRGAWTELLDGIYLGTLLLHYYLEREMTVAHLDADSARLQFADGAAVFVKRDNSRLLVTNGDVVIADDFERFIPRGNSIYAYSRDGSNRTWKLPVNFRDKTVEVRTLGDSGKSNGTVHVGDEIALALAPRVPVKVTLVASG